MKLIVEYYVGLGEGPGTWFVHTQELELDWPGLPHDEADSDLFNSKLLSHFDLRGQDDYAFVGIYSYRDITPDPDDDDDYDADESLRKAEERWSSLEHWDGPPSQWDIEEEYRIQEFEEQLHALPRMCNYCHKPITNAEPIPWSDGEVYHPECALNLLRENKVREITDAEEAVIQAWGNAVVPGVMGENPVTFEVGGMEIAVEQRTYNTYLQLMTFAKEQNSYDVVLAFITAAKLLGLGEIISGGPDPDVDDGIHDGKNFDEPYPTEDDPYRL